MLQVDEQTANAVNGIATRMPNEWAILEDYVARALCGVRDKLETAPNKEHNAGVAEGLRHLFEVRRKAYDATKDPNEPKQGTDKVVIGEQEYVKYNHPRTEESWPEDL